MANISPFRGLRYNTKKIKNINKVFAPPYDVISEAERDKLYKQHSNNVIKLILGKQSKKDTVKNNRYTRAKADFFQWIDDEIMIFDEKPSIYVYTQDYTFEGVKKKRIGFVSCLRFDDKDEGCLPHEQTLAKPKKDRIQLMQSVEANLSPIFSFYIDNKNAIDTVLKPYTRKKALIDYTDKDNIRHKFWKVDDVKTISKVKTLMKGKRVFIADGHHRYEVSRSYYEQMRKKSKAGNHNQVMVYFTGFNEENLSVMPTHRLVKGVKNLDARMKDIEKYFTKTPCKNLNDMLAKQAKEKGFTLGMCFKGKFNVLTMKDNVLLNRLMRKSPSQWKKLDVAMLNKVVFEHIFKLNASQKEEKISYTRDAQFAATAVKKKLADVAFFPNPTKADQVKKIALAKYRMPQKSTYFYPKPITGLVIHKF
ncbi:MAG: DUF1015 domain-containing protein [PVC group bacterium]|nr:DUF1015 domain-containing protein [PVC group bacterium]